MCTKLQGVDCLPRLDGGTNWAQVRARRRGVPRADNDEHLIAKDGQRSVGDVVIHPCLEARPLSPDMAYAVTAMIGSGRRAGGMVVSSRRARAQEHLNTVATSVA